MIVVVILVGIGSAAWTIRRLADRLSKLEDFTQATLVGVIEKNAIAMTTMTDAMADNTRALQTNTQMIIAFQEHIRTQDADLKALLNRLLERPCLVPKT